MSRWKRVLLFISVMGPGILAANIGNDGSGITTYSVAGARFGYSILWTMIPTTIFLIVIQNMVARLGVVTGKGLSALIRENYGVRATFFVMTALFIANLGTAVANFAGLAASVEILGFSKYLVLPLIAVSIWVLVTKGTYMVIERILLGACFIYTGYIISAFLAGPDWSQLAYGTLIPTLKWDHEFIILTVAIIGTTITPWMQFYLQSSIADKGVKIENYNATKADVIFGSVTTDTVSFFIMLTCAATLFVHGIRIEEASEAAIALRPLAGDYAFLLFALCLGNAALLGAIVVPLTTAYVICEGMGWESGLNKTFKEAPQFLGIYTAIISSAGILVLIPGAPLVLLMVLASFMNGLLLPFVLLYVINLANNKRVMGDYINSKGYNYIAWATVFTVISLTAFLVVTTIFPAG